MKFLVFAVSALAAVLAEKNQTQPCKPDKYQAVLYCTDGSVCGNHAVDWTKNRSVVTLPSFQLIYLLDNMKGYYFNTTDEDCEVFDLKSDQIPPRCLPQNLVIQLKGTSSAPNAADGADFLNYDFISNEESKVEEIFSPTKRIKKTLEKLTDAERIRPGNVVIFTNTLDTDDVSPSLFQYHANCPYFSGLQPEAVQKPSK